MSIMPVSDFVANFVNSLGAISRSIPLAGSIILIVTPSSLSSSFMPMIIVPPFSLVNLIELSTRLDMT
jgi:hypothetical protein